MFGNRADAGKQLSKRLQAYKTDSPVVLALPRGGVVLGAAIAHTLHAPLDIIAVRKVGHPNNPEYAIGAVDESTTLLEETALGSVNQQWLQEEITRQKAEAMRRSNIYRSGRKPLDVSKKIVFLVDDGIATGLTMRLAVRSVKAQKPEKIIVAVPVAPEGTVQELKSEGVDEVIVLEPPEKFMGAVGAHYARFEQVEDDEVIRLMQEAGAE
ncbi:phosphoribosyl transferase [Candidatus Kaiserbacteria bacterium]|nr:phosphoribosyl transferase [Candidatus Kaiserbacteria bacterium]